MKTQTEKKNIKHVKHDIKTLSTKTFQVDGKWIEKPRISVVEICVCGNKYIKTRKNQSTCVRCMHSSARVA